MIRVILPAHLRNLARTGREVTVEAAAPATIETVLDAIEARYPMLRGTIRDQSSHRRRDFIRFFALGQDLSHDPPGNPLPDPILSGEEPLWIVGAMAGG